MIKALLALLLFAVLSAQAFAGPLEDAKSAYDRKDFLTALRIYRQLADQGDAEAQYMIGQMHTYPGTGVEHDYSQAEIWFRKAAEKGYADAQVGLAFIYLNGRGATANLAEAIKWFERAAEQGEEASRSVLNLINIIRHVPVNTTQVEYLYFVANDTYNDGAFGFAALAFRSLADYGEALAQLNLGFMYSHGQGVPQDFVQAHKWVALAASGFPPDEAELRTTAVQLRDIIADKMTPKQMAEAQKLARKWKPKAK